MVITLPVNGRSPVRNWYRMTPAVEVGAVNRQPEELLWRHIGGRAEHHPDLGKVGRLDLGDAEVRHLYLAVFSDEDIRRLDIPVHYAAAV